MSDSPRQRPFIIVVVPTYNEAANLATLTREVLAQGPNYHLIVVDDNSPDGTGKLADALAKEHPGRIEVIHRLAKRGLGPAYIAGFQRALRQKPDLVAQMDADLSHDPRALPVLVAATAECDLAIGSRYVPGGGTLGWPLWRRALSRLGGAYARIVLRAPVADLTGGFKVWRRPMLEQIDVAGMRSDGYAFSIEATWRALRHGARVREVPIVFSDRVAGASKLSRRIVLEAAVIVWRLRWEGRAAICHSEKRGISAHWK